MNPFGYINSLNYKYEVSDLKGYSAFLTNRFFSYFHDSVLLANIANSFMRPSIEQYDFWFNTVSKKKRFVPKWHKKIAEDDHIQMLAERYQISKIRAKKYLKFLSEDEITELTEWWNAQNN